MPAGDGVTHVDAPVQSRGLALQSAVADGVSAVVVKQFVRSFAYPSVPLYRLHVFSVDEDGSWQS